MRYNNMTMFLDNCWMAEVFVISGIIKVEVSVIGLAQRSWLFRDITMQKLNLATVFVTRYCFEEKKNNERQTPDRRTEHRLTLLLEIMHWARNLARVVQTLDSARCTPDKSLFSLMSSTKTNCAIHWIEIISSGWRYPPFEQLGPAD